MKSFPQVDGAGEENVAKSLHAKLHFHFMSSVLGEHLPSCHFVGLPLGGLCPPCKGPETWKRSNSILGEKVVIHSSLGQYILP